MTNTINSLIANHARARQLRAENLLDVVIFAVQAAMWLGSVAAIVVLLSINFGV